MMSCVYMAILLLVYIRRMNVKIRHVETESRSPHSHAIVRTLYKGLHSSSDGEQRCKSTACLTLGHSVALHVLMWRL